MAAPNLVPFPQRHDVDGTVQSLGENLLALASAILIHQVAMPPPIVVGAGKLCREIADLDARGGPGS